MTYGTIYSLEIRLLKIHIRKYTFRNTLLKIHVRKKLLKYTFRNTLTVVC